MGTIPASRGKNHKDRLRLVSQANSEMFDMLGELQSRGESIALYPESTHNYTNPEKLLPIRPGIGEIAIRSLQYTRPALVPIGVSYGPEYTQIDENTAKPAHIRRAQAYIGEVTRLDQDMSVEDVVAITAHTLQDAVDHAHALYAERTK
jgi:1-acyl-sn-glycerol-3-phosphate acyltransferase